MKRYKVSLIAVITCLALLLTAAAAFGYRNLKPAGQTCEQACHYTIKATDISKLPYAKAVNYAIQKGVFTLSKGKFNPNAPITNSQFRTAVLAAYAGNNVAAIPNDNKTFNRAKLAEYLAKIMGANVAEVDTSQIADYNGNKYVAWAANNGYLTITKRINNKMVTNPSGTATRADAAYAITMAGLIQTTKSAKPNGRAEVVSLLHSKVDNKTLVEHYAEWSSGKTNIKSAQFCLYCHDDTPTYNGQTVPDATYRYSAIVDIVYSVHYLQRVYADKDGDGFADPGMQNRI
ncbi:hypothetical protein ciss_15280 [Carboxydothermus islandicus]|uniref:SLH domain-containing protein n=1 Tax=Carboxydothermus islandicus TaxID=661089 RepID=A0A1L8D332_9THEO|nr:S-layer homology domain-containing protein [Carboxydothermus islandicus]GAV25595.1 hypothetical protein ciss_15280 [Carboxydothermus islandicus]